MDAAVLSTSTEAGVATGSVVIIPVAQRRPVAPGPLIQHNWGLVLDGRFMAPPRMSVYACAGRDSDGPPGECGGCGERVNAPYGAIWADLDIIASGLLDEVRNLPCRRCGASREGGVAACGGTCGNLDADQEPPA